LIRTRRAISERPCGQSHGAISSRARPRVTGGLLGLFAAALLSIEAASGQAAEVEILAAGDLRGEIKPCGCSLEGQLGGLPRRLTFLEQATRPGAAAPPILVDLGNNFPEPSEQGRLKIELIQSLLKRFPPAAILPGPNELTMGLSTLDRELPYLVSNDAVGRAFLPSVTVERAGVRIGIYGYLSLELVYQEFADRYRFVPVDGAWLAVLRERMRAAGEARAILLFRGGDRELEAFVKAKLFDRIVMGNPSSDELNQVVRRELGGALLPQVPTKGQGFLRIPLALDTVAAERPGEPIWLSDQYADHPVARQAFADYDEKVKGLFFARLQRMEQSRDSPYAGAEACAACHARSAETWRASRHAHALATLERVGKQFDPECLACHVVGLSEGGFLSQELTPHLANVQCENCHGPARAHIGNPVNMKPAPATRSSAEHGSPEQVCRTCHHGSHSPTFAFPAYWPRIAHGRE
jgi:hypothetical protein